ncbi:MAG: hypothetical protein M1830_005774 [Pleopsidium flavum]|nr:MAG: hypothetical protein M1830_005774 [Pleopsidium flavum]
MQTLRNRADVFTPVRSAILGSQVLQRPGMDELTKAEVNEAGSRDEHSASDLLSLTFAMDDLIGTQLLLDAVILATKAALESIQAEEDSALVEQFLNLIQDKKLKDDSRPMFLTLIARYTEGGKSYKSFSCINLPQEAYIGPPAKGVQRSIAAGRCK